MIRARTEAAEPISSRETGGDRFVIVTNGRSGSTYLSSCLDSHPQLTCYHELFKRTASIERVKPFHLSTHADPMAYIEEVIVRTRAGSGIRLVGFKHHFHHNPGALEQVLGDPRQRIILLCRRDKLAQWASRRLAQVTGQWTRAKTNAEIDLVKQVPFKLRRYTAFLLHERAWERYVLKKRPDCLRLDYEDIVRPGGMVPILRYLGVDHGVELMAWTHRQFTGEVTEERFSNPRWAALGSRVAFVIAGLATALGAMPLIRGFTR